MSHTTTILLVLSLLAGCGVDVASTAAVSGMNRAQEAQQAAQTQEQFRQKLDAALQAGQQQRESLDKSAGQ